MLSRYQGTKIRDLSMSSNTSRQILPKQIWSVQVHINIVTVLFLFSVLQRNLRRSIQDKLETSMKLRTLLSSDSVIKMINILVLIWNTNCITFPHSLLALGQVMVKCLSDWPLLSIEQFSLWIHDYKLFCFRANLYHGVHKLMWSNLRCLADPCLSIWCAYPCEKEVCLIAHL